MLKDSSIFSSGGHLVYRSVMILAVLVGSHLGNIPTKFGSRVQEKLALKQIVDDARQTLTDHNSSP